MQDKRDRFDSARLKVLAESGSSEGIGRLSEKSVHKILKLYIDPDESNHEREICGSYADVFNSEGIYEIQTRAAWRLVKKLPKFLSVSRVTVVIPVISENRIRWLNKETGEISDGRRSNKKENAFTALGEVYRLREFLFCEGFLVRLVFLKTEEFRYLDGKDPTRHKGSTKIDKIPTELVDDITLSKPEDYLSLLPDGLSEPFLEKDLRRMLKYPARISSAVIGVLKQMGVIRQIGKSGRAHLYEKTKTHTDVI